MNNAQRVVVQLMGETTTGAPDIPEDRPPTCSRLPSWVIESPPEHILGGPCWCQPTIEEKPDGGRLVIHRRTIDSPRYEQELG